MTPTQEILEGDCLEIMKGFADKSFDLVLTDPPYGIGGWSENHTGGFMTKEKAAEVNLWDKFAPSKEYFDELFRVSKNQIIWGGNYFSLPPSPKLLIWDKGQRKMHFAEAEIAWTSLDLGTTRVLNHHIKSSEIFGNKQHPTQKPIEVIRWCLSFFPEAQTILDPFMGSGTTLVAAKFLNRNAVGIEISPKYCEIARKRLAQESLFTAPEIKPPSHTQPLSL